MEATKFQNIDSPNERIETGNISNEEEFLPLDTEELTPFLKLKAKNELHETEEKLLCGLKELKKLIKEQNVPCCTDDRFLVMFLRVRKFDLPRAFEHVKAYSSSRHSMMNYYGFMSLEKIKQVLNCNGVGLLPKRDEEGRVIIYFLLDRLNIENTEPDDIIRTIQALGHYALTFPATQVSGFCVIADTSGGGKGAWRLLYKYLRFILPTLHIFPGRFQKVDILNTSGMVRALLKLIRPFIPSKLLERVTFHGSNKDDLLKSYNPSILPEEFGGKLGSIESLAEKWRPKFEQFVPQLQASNAYYKRKDTIPYPESLD